MSLEQIESVAAEAGIWLLALSVGTFLLALVALPLLLVKLPEDYLIRDSHAPPEGHLLRRALLNLVGLVLVLAGLLMLVLPGQGILTLIAGLMLMDFPGKHRVLVKLLSRPSVLKGVNALRVKASAKPLAPPAG